MIIWDEDKDQQLKLERNISFEEISEVILDNKYLDILDHPRKPNQSIFVIEIKDYIYAVPFVIDENSNIILKTVYPSRKLYNKYKGGVK
ncbi:MAG: BrnT family toxin [Candidatus Ratteibacteria bacterium]|nr:BrnT family toxin [Candidatus Ratteibacteria bacterium]